MSRGKGGLIATLTISHEPESMRAEQAKAARSVSLTDAICSGLSYSSCMRLGGKLKGIPIPSEHQITRVSEDLK